MSDIKKKMAAKYFIDGTFFAPICGLCVNLNFMSLSIFVFFNFLCFTLFLLLFLIIFYNLWMWL